jgi:hypothetical protein
MSRSNGHSHHAKTSIQTCQDNPSFLDCIVTGDESWVFKYDPETKRQSMQWTSKSSGMPKKFHLQKSKIKTTLTTFFDTHGLIHKGFVPEGQIVNSAFYVEVIGRLLKRISPVRPQFREECSWFMLHDNAPSHSALVVKPFLAKHGIVEISHPPYSPDLAPADYFLFLTVNTTLKGKRFQDVEDNKKNVMAELNAVPFEVFADCFQKPFERCNKCIQVGGDYFE